MDQEKEFVGSVSLCARIHFAVKESDIDKAKSIVFDDIEGLEVVLKDGSKVELLDLSWDLVDSASTGNYSESHIRDFYIDEDS